MYRVKPVKNNQELFLVAELKQNTYESRGSQFFYAMEIVLIQTENEMLCNGTERSTGE